MSIEKASQQEQEEVIEQAQAQAQSMMYYHAPQQSPREYLHNYLIHAKNAGCMVDHYILDEINQMLAELKR